MWKKRKGRASELDFKVGGTGGGMERWKILSATMVGRQETFSNSRRSRMAKTIIFWPWWQPFNRFCFETLSFLPLSPFFIFAPQKSGEAMPPPPAPRVSPALKGFTPPCRGALPSEPVSQYRCMNLAKSDDNDRTHIEIMQTPYILTYGQYFFLDKCLIWWATVKVTCLEIWILLC